ncbi:MAG: hypothetical protein LBM18_05630 [Oscillospiraceae bacterium]|jgi:hypothetical protein|nr:hypothetical protein [Oscillospiraceae bacterium]
MNTDELAAKCGFRKLTEAPPKEIEGAFAGDLLSWAMSRVSRGDAWFTVMGNLNAVAVAALSDCACIVLCHGSALSQDALERAVREEIVILATEEPVYNAALASGIVNR